MTKKLSGLLLHGLGKNVIKGSAEPPFEFILNSPEWDQDGNFYTLELEELEADDPSIDSLCDAIKQNRMNKISLRSMIGLGIYQGSYTQAQLLKLNETLLNLEGNLPICLTMVSHDLSKQTQLFNYILENIGRYSHLELICNELHDEHLMALLKSLEKAKSNLDVLPLDSLEFALQSCSKIALDSLQTFCNANNITLKLDDEIDTAVDEKSKLSVIENTESMLYQFICEIFTDNMTLDDIFRNSQKTDFVSKLKTLLEIYPIDDLENRKRFEEKISSMIEELEAQIPPREKLMREVILSGPIAPALEKRNQWQAEIEEIKEEIRKYQNLIGEFLYSQRNLKRREVRDTVPSAKYQKMTVEKEQDKTNAEILVSPKNGSRLFNHEKAQDQFESQLAQAIAESLKKPSNY